MQVNSISWQCSFARFKDNLLSGQAAIESQYFPPVSYFALYGRYSQIHLIKSERFEKQTYRNRCRILTSNSVQDLIVPVQKGKTQLTTGEVQIIYRQNWIRLHERAIATAYGRAPYFVHYFHQVVEILSSCAESIYELNMKTIRWAERILELKPAQPLSDGSHLVDGLDLRSSILPKKAATLDAMGRYQAEPYFQCFDHLGFAPNLSVLDLIMNHGPESHHFLGNWQ